jgi:hypothetical protein
VQAGVRFEGVFAAGYPVQGGTQAGGRDLDEKAEVAVVHPEHRCRPPHEHAHGAEHGAVAAEADHDVRPVDEVLRGDSPHVGADAGGVDVPGDDVGPALTRVLGE